MLISTSAPSEMQYRLPIMLVNEVLSSIHNKRIQKQMWGLLKGQCAIDGNLQKPIYRPHVA